ncbi:MAG: hypothetical protein ABFR47_03330 [Verrucomicrobiota bacterium]
MSDGLLQLAFIGPGGPELLVVMLVLLLMFGAKDAPRILRKLNEIISHIRNTADGFKREVMYGDLESDTSLQEGEDTAPYDEEDVLLEPDEPVVVPSDEDGDAEKA